MASVEKLDFSESQPFGVVKSFAKKVANNKATDNIAKGERCVWWGEVKQNQAGMLYQIPFGNGFHLDTSVYHGNLANLQEICKPNLAFASFVFVIFIFYYIRHGITKQYMVGAIACCNIAQNTDLTIQYNNSYSSVEEFRICQCGNEDCLVVVQQQAQNLLLELLESLQLVPSCANIDLPLPMPANRIKYLGTCPNVNIKICKIRV